MAKLPDIAIIGAGKVGTAIGILAARAGYQITAVAGRSRRSAAAAARVIGGKVDICRPAEAAGAGELVLLTVPDDAIEGVCGELAGAHAFRRGAVVAHCSGALGSDVLSSARRCCGCAVGSMHPLQTFADSESAAGRFAGTYCFIEGDEPAAAALQRLAEAIGGKAFTIDVQGKLLYHAAAVMACNYLAALADAAVQLCARAGINGETALAAMGPLIRAAADNVVAVGPAAALTGPIARGDIETIRRHLKAMGQCPPQLRELYRAAGAWTIQLARRKGTIDAAEARALHEALGTRNEKEVIDGCEDN